VGTSSAPRFAYRLSAMALEPPPHLLRTHPLKNPHILKAKPDTYQYNFRILPQDCLYHTSAILLHVLAIPRDPRQSGRAQTGNSATRCPDGGMMIIQRASHKTPSEWKHSTILFRQTQARAVYASHRPIPPTHIYQCYSSSILRDESDSVQSFLVA
jgi:hypothetical protein